ncbi:MAG: hypothetical protein HXY34_08345 [Candidatus Thorarchaeota archaeon]|nr:hypothetical protein [Candidatus Thorarchaeota archaeon]
MDEAKLSYNDFFPYPAPRSGQLAMMESIEDAVRRGKHICCEAPNGFGKTVVTLAGVLPWIKENSGRLLYCARTHRQIDRVMEELSAISERTDVAGVSFRGRQQMCLNEYLVKNAEAGLSASEMCRHLKAEGRCPYYERLKTLSAPEDILADMTTRVLTATELIRLARRRELCPYEFAKKLARAVDVVALSYLYIFDPFILESFLPELEVPLSRVVLVQDEAHNVPQTAIDSASDSLALTTVRQALEEGIDHHDSISERFSRALAQAMLEASGKMMDSDEKLIDPSMVHEQVLEKGGFGREDNPIEHMMDLGEKIRRGQLRAGRAPRSAIHRVASFMSTWLEYAKRDDYAFFMTSDASRGDSRRVSLDLVALDPTVVTGPVLSRVRCSVAVSGTISPVEAYSDMLGFGPDASSVQFGSPFSKDSRIGIVVRGLDTSYEKRSREMYTRMVQHCIAVAHSTPGNTGIFTTSYSVSRALVDAGLSQQLRRPLFIEKADMKGEANDRMVEEFKQLGESGGAVLLGVQGGRNSEGGDFPGPTMDSVVVVGVSYARPTPKSGELIRYFDRRFNGRGKDYAYVLPAMTRAVQAAGRPVRRMSDRGAIVLLDQRFATSYLKRFMPSWLREVLVELPDDPDAVAMKLNHFFATRQD